MEFGERPAGLDQGLEEPTDVDDSNKQVHEGFMREALAMAELALSTDETPVGCVFVHNGTIIGRGMNATNRTRNGTRHAEFEAIADLLSTPADTDRSTTPNAAPFSDPANHARVPPATKPRKYNASILQECDLYVTVEPCIMCASLLRQYRIRKVYYGATNERFGGTGGVLSIHQDGVPEPAYPVSGGWLREEAILILRRFYVQQNEKAPESKMRKKERLLKTEVEPATKRPARSSRELQGIIGTEDLIDGSVEATGS